MDKLRLHGIRLFLNMLQGPEIGTPHEKQHPLFKYI